MADGALVLKGPVRAASQGHTPPPCSPTRDEAVLSGPPFPLPGQTGAGHPPRV